MQVLFEFCYKSIVEAAEFFFRTIANELVLQKQIAEESIRKYQGEVKDMKDD